MSAVRRNLPLAATRRDPLVAAAVSAVVLFTAWPALAWIAQGAGWIVGMVL